MTALLTRLLAHWRRRDRQARVAHQGLHMSRMLREEMRANHEVTK